MPLTLSHIFILTLLLSWLTVGVGVVAAGDDKNGFPSVGSSIMTCNYQSCLGIKEGESDRLMLEMTLKIDWKSLSSQKTLKLVPLDWEAHLAIQEPESEIEKKAHNRALKALRGLPMYSPDRTVGEVDEADILKRITPVNMVVLKDGPFSSEKVGSLFVSPPTFGKKEILEAEDGTKSIRYAETLKSKATSIWMKTRRNAAKGKPAKPFTYVELFYRDGLGKGSLWVLNQTEWSKLLDPLILGNHRAWLFLIAMKPETESQRVVMGAFADLATKAFMMNSDSRFQHYPWWSDSRFAFAKGNESDFTRWGLAEFIKKGVGDKKVRLMVSRGYRGRMLGGKAELVNGALLTPAMKKARTREIETLSKFYKKEYFGILKPKTLPKVTPEAYKKRYRNAFNAQLAYLKKRG